MQLTSFIGLGPVLLASCLVGCFGYVEHDHERPGGGYRSDEPSVQGIPCDHLRGEVTLTDYDGDNYPSSSFNFEFGTQDPEITYNEYDLLYEGNTFYVNLVTDDRSYIVDLGDVPLVEVPETVDPSEYPLGMYGEHDHIDAVIDHTYFVRSVDGSGRHVAAFRVTGLEPGVRATISWLASTDPDRLRVPSGCGL